jgi:hypothetical protein
MIRYILNLIDTIGIAILEVIERQIIKNGISNSLPKEPVRRPVLPRKKPSRKARRTQRQAAKRAREREILETINERHENQALDNIDTTNIDLPSWSDYNALRRKDRIYGPVSNT